MSGAAIIEERTGMGDGTHETAEAPHPRSDGADQMPLLPTMSSTSVLRPPCLRPPRPIRGCEKGNYPNKFSVINGGLLANR